ncbi:MoxR-like ATPase [Arthrobacter roseus]|nr:MoxR family ATPase [Arthrobacter roseus]MBM7848760.1 MoxR-like ATPase [Arthrobacter roseus]
MNARAVPGLAKTTAAQTLADAIAVSFSRIQCTPDLLPSDIVGTQIYNAGTGTFKTELGPVHASIVLLDEINRSSSKTQSAMLEAMQERQTSIGGAVYPMPSPFLVLATQNPIEQEGTYVLPEAQLDRFLFKERLQYPSAAEEAEVVRRVHDGRLEGHMDPVVGRDEILRLQADVPRIYLDASLVEYIVSLVHATRYPGGLLTPELVRMVQWGASPRASIAFSRAARCVALLQGRDHVLPEDIKELAHRVLRHRIILGFEAVAAGVTQDDVVDALLATVRTP